jgi:TonB family protein
MANAWPTPRLSSDHLDTAAAARNESAEASGGPIPNSLDFSHLVDSLRASATGLQHELDTLLAGVTLAAFELAGATGAALALRTHGAVVCRSRAGATAPPVGTQLDMDSGISGACLRTGVAQLCSDTASDPRVDAEASRKLGVRSLAAVPLLDQSEVVGILEIFSDRSGAFSQSHIALLQHLADIAVAGRNPLAERDIRLPEIPASIEVAAPANYPAPTFAAPFADVAAIEPSSSGTIVRWTPRRVRVALAVLAVLISVGWLAFRRSSSPTSPAILTKAGAAVSAAGSARPGDGTPGAEKNGLAAQSFAPSSQKPAAGLTAAANEVLVPAADRAPLRRNAIQVVAPTKSTAPSTGAASAPEDVTPPEVSQLTSPQGDAALPLSIVSSVQLPLKRLEVSQGVTGGTLVHQVAPVYPKAAKVQRIEGPVTLQAIVNEDGSVQNVNVVSGDPLLAHAAQQAVAQWRYSPYLLNGKPVSMRAEITVQFKLP